MTQKFFRLGLVGLILVGTFMGINDTNNVESIGEKTDISYAKGFYIPHVPIRINSDSDPVWTEFPSRVISGYEINGTGYGFCIYIGNCSKPFTVKDCYLRNATNMTSIKYFWNSGAILYNSSNGLVSYNKCSGNMCGISLWFSFKNIVTNNNCTINNEGIPLSHASNNTFINNICFLNNGTGISLWTDSCDNNTITFNVFENNIGFGVSIPSNSIFNKINHNNFIKNHIMSVQGLDYTKLNFWNTSTAGNYWSDWIGPDSNGDGIVDNPYRLDGGLAQDHKPLTNIVKIIEFSPTASIIMGIVLTTMVSITIRRFDVK